ncbi:MAG: ABC transporter substrate-binding protein [Oscillospiraceae bacterium]|nr:ABC transporter substrate-binding protein [Oscillospiraceae bacterium]
MKKTRWIALVLALCLALCFAACAGKEPPAPTQAPGTAAPAPTQAPGTEAPAPTDAPVPAAEPKILKLAESFAYASLDAHKDWNGWYTSIYGLTETLFKVGNDLSVQPLLAQKAEADGKTWTITLDPKASFSNGKPLTADMVARNLMRVGEVNERFSDVKDYVITAVDEHTLTITTPEVYPTLLTDKLTNAAFGIMDLDAGADLDHAPVCTGPFVVKSFEPEGTVEVAKNDSYWKGSVKLDGVVFYYMNDDESKLMAMQSGEIDGYSGVTAAAKQIYQADPSQYVLTEIPATRLQFYVLNENRLSDNVRKAVNLTVDNAAIAQFLGGTVSPAVGPFGASAPYGQVTKPQVDAAAAKAALEADGYTLNGDGMYEKDGKVLTLNICYYYARSLDSIALLMEQQLKAVGVAAALTGVEDADSTYRVTGDYDIALYCMIADQAGDPYYAINALFRQGSDWALGGFHSDECEALINELQSETDVDRRSELANRIVQMVIDDNAFGFVGLFNKTTVAAPGVVNIGENCPFDFYAVSAETDMP